MLAAQASLEIHYCISYFSIVVINIRTKAIYIERVYLGPWFQRIKVNNGELRQQAWREQKAEGSHLEL